MPANTIIEDAIRAALILDPRLPEPGEIAVSVNDGVVTLRGTVGSFTQRRAAVADTRKVHGVEDIQDGLKVRLLDEARRNDADIRGAALQRLMWDVEVLADRIDVKAENGWVTLEGNVAFQFESDVAYSDVANLVGVVGVTNLIRVNER